MLTDSMARRSTQFEYCCDMSGPDLNLEGIKKLPEIRVLREGAKGSFEKRGRYNDIPRPDSYIAFNFGEMTFQDFVSTLWSYRNMLASVGDEYRQCDVAYYHEGQCNLEFAVADMEKLSELGMGISVSCYDVNDEDQRQPGTKRAARRAAPDRPAGWCLGEVRAVVLSFRMCSTINCHRQRFATPSHGPALPCVLHTQNKA